MPFCTNCGNKMGDGFNFCPECGEKIILESDSEDYMDGITTFNSHTKVCMNCGDAMPDVAFYCLNCGNIYGNSNEDFEDIQKRVSLQFGTWKKKWVSFFLCLFLGWLGAHKFYDGKIGMGLLYMFTFGLFVIGWFIDIIIILFKPNPYFVKRKR